MSGNNLFITFEGIDGCGKTTQISLLAQYLESRGYKVTTIREPGGTELSEQIRDVLLNSRSQISAVTELMLFSAARSHLTDEIIIPALNKGHVVLCDRFFDSTTAYQGYGRGIDINFIESVNKKSTKGMVPDLTIYLDLELSISSQRTKHKKPDRMEKSGSEFFERVIMGFRQIAAQNKDRVKLIDASKDEETTFQKIMEVLETVFGAFNSVPLQSTNTETEK